MGPVDFRYWLHYFQLLVYRELWPYLPHHYLGQYLHLYLHWNCSSSLGMWLLFVCYCWRRFSLDGPALSNLDWDCISRPSWSCTRLGGRSYIHVIHIWSWSCLFLRHGENWRDKRWKKTIQLESSKKYKRVAPPPGVHWAASRNASSCSEPAC